MIKNSHYKSKPDNMKRLLTFLLLLLILFSCKNKAPRVLLYIEGNSSDLAYMLENEAGRMTEILEEAGYVVKTATTDGEVLKTDSVTLKPDFMLKEVNTADYAGLIMPCMAAQDSIVTDEEIALVKKFVYEGKPVAASTGAVFILGKAGELTGRKFAFIDETENNASMYHCFRTAEFSGRGVVKDGNIITSGTCPMMAKTMGHKDGTDELTTLFIETIKSKTR